MISSKPSDPSPAFKRCMPSSRGVRESRQNVWKSRDRAFCAAFKVYIRTPEWAARAYSARVKVWWPAWFRIRDMWGDVAPDTITFEMMSKWRAALEKRHGRGVAHKTLRVWRTFWKIMLGMRVARTADPSMGIRNRAPAPRWQRWRKGRRCVWSNRLGATAITVWHALSLWPGIRNSPRSTFALLPHVIAA